jgi:hypothetical protein
LEHAELRVDQAQAILDAVERILNTAERSQAAVERARSTLRTFNVVVLGATAVLGAVIVIAGRHH